jgi:hypothetical protein
MAKGDTYNNATSIQLGGTTTSIQPSGSAELCLYWATSGGQTSVINVENYAIQAQSWAYGNGYTYPYAYANQLHGIPSTSVKEINMPFRLTLDNTNYIVIEGTGNSSYHAAYWLSGIYLA